MGLVISWITVALGLLVADKLVPNFEVKGAWTSYVVVAAILGVLHFFLGWLLYVVIGIASLGIGFIFGFVTRLLVSAIVLKLADKLSSRLEIRGFLPALLGAVVLALSSGVVDFLRR